MVCPIFLLFCGMLMYGDGMQMSNLVDKSCLYALNDESTLDLQRLIVI